MAFDINGILRAVDATWAEEMREIDRAFVEAISDERYEWPNQTLRQNGEVVGSPRNIVDTGRLVGSQYINTIMPGDAEFGWTEDNPELNHNGGMNVINGHRYYHTPRPWTQHAISGDSEAPLEYQRSDAILNVPEDFAQKLSTYLELTPDAD
jgi:hypothetical protein